MNNKLKFILLALVFFINILHSEEKVLKIAITKDMVPYTFFDNNKQPRGLFVDYWKLWSKKTGIKVKFVALRWDESINALKDGLIDFHSGLFINEKRLKSFDFTERIYISQSHIYATDTNKKIKNIKDLDGKTIGLLSETYFENYVIQNFPKAKIKIYGGMDSLFTAIKNKEVDFFIDDSLIIWFQLIKNYSFNKVNLLPDFQLNNWFHGAVKKGNTELLKKINDGMNKITFSEIIKIEKKWIVENSFRYFEQKQKIDLLTYEERLWLLNNPNIKIAVVKDWEKYSILNKNNEVEGFHIDLINQINKNLGTSFKIKAFDTWSEAYTSAKEGNTHAIPGLSWSKEREKTFNYSPSYQYSSYYIVSHKDNNQIKSKKDFSGKTAVTYENSITNQIITDLASDVTFTHANSVKKILEIVNNNEADFALIENAKVIDLDKYDVKIVDSFFSRYSELSIGVNKKYEKLANILKQGINSITQNQMSKLKANWLNKTNLFTNEENKYIKNSQPLVVGIEDWVSIIDMSEDGKISGIGGEIAIKAFDVSGLKIKYIKKDWDLLLEDFKDGKIDILPTTLYTKQRDAYGEFTNKYLSLRNYIYVKSDNKSIKSLKDLNNKKLALQKDFATVTLIKEKFPDIELVETKNLEESISKVLNGEVDALFELQVSVENQMRELLVTNLKAVSQSVFKSQGLHMFIQEDNKILKDILNKSLLSIPSIDKNQIISKWISPVNSKKEVNIAFTKQIPPYVIKKEHIKGIDYDIVNKVLSLSKIKIKNSKHYVYQKIDTHLNETPTTDIAVGVRTKSDRRYFYSDNLLSFHDVVVSRVNDDFIIEKFTDLLDKKLLAYKNANIYLGREFNLLFNEKSSPKTYSEIVNQKIQVQKFLDGKVDVIILDEKIFKWYLKKLSNKSIDEFKLHDIITEQIPRYVAFKDKNLRDVFNFNLRKIKRSGVYDLIIEDYTKDFITTKTKINSLISMILAKYIYYDDTQTLNKVINIFKSLSYIKDIEVCNNEKELLSNKSVENKNYYNEHESFYFVQNIPKKVGYVKVYFENEVLDKYKNLDLLIPQLDLFKSFFDYESIKDVFVRLGYQDKMLIFSRDEMRFLENKKTIKFTSSHWEPISIIDAEQKTYAGVIADYLEIIEKETGIEFEYVYSSSWLEALNKFKNGEVDLIPGIGQVGTSLKNAVLTDKMTEFKYAMVSKKEKGFIEGLDDLKDMKIASPKSYSSNHLLKNSIYNFDIIETENEKDAFKLVANGEADIFITHSAIAVYNIKNSFSNLKIVGLTDEKFKHHIAVQDKYPELLSILNKVIYNITAKQKQDIRYKWIQTEVTTAVDYSLLYKIIFAFVVVIVIVLFFNRKLSSAKDEIEKTNSTLREFVNRLKITQEELLSKTKDLEEQKMIFETLFNDTSDGLALIKNGKFIACNNSILKMLKCKSKDDILNLKPEEISPPFQEYGVSSKEKSDLCLDVCREKSTNRFEWIYKDFEKNEFWVEVVLTKITLNDEEVIHVVWRDIADKKVLEEQNLRRTLELEDTNTELEMSLKNLKQTQNQLIESEKMASLGGLVAGVAHEINTPVGIGLTGISHFQEITKDIKKSYSDEKMTQEEFEDYLNTSYDLANLITLNLKKAGNLVKSFKQVAVDQTSEERRIFNLNKYIYEVLSSIHSITKKTNLSIKVICDENLKVNSYPGAFSQILTNLIMNSIIHGYEKEQEGELLIEASKKDDELTLIYKDDGKGISVENQNKIFDPFFTTNRENGGSGLGLNIIYNIVSTKLNGKIKCNSQGKGVEFIVTVKV